ncbi:MAG: serine protease [Terriglobales bacterium]
MKSSQIALCLIVLIASCLQAQESILPPPYMFVRTSLIKVGNEYGTAFVIDHRNKQYLVTAKHLVSSLPAKNAVVQLFQSFEWRNLKVNIVTCKNEDVDAVALQFDTPDKISLDPAIEPLGKSVVLLGSEVFFFGYPSGGLHTLAANNGQYLPFVKHGFLSASDWTNTDAVIYYVDGFNNKGFSGGPIIGFVQDKKEWRVIAVVSGYLPESTQVKVGREMVDSKQMVNSGILVGYSIQHVLDAIDSSLEAGASR